MKKQIRVLVAKPGLDGHDRGALIISQALRDYGMEVIYTGLRQTPAQIVAAAVQEDVDAIGLSCLSGAHNELFPDIIQLLKEQKAEDIIVIGGGVIPAEDIPFLESEGIQKIFTPGTPTIETAKFIERAVYERDGISLDQPFAVNQIDHIGIAVKSIDEALSFYKDTLNLTFEGVEEVVSQKVKVAFFNTGNCRLELLEPMSEESAVASFIEKRGEGIHHIALGVEDINSRIKQLQEKDVRMIDTKARTGAEGADVAFLHPKAAHGVLYELCEKQTRG
ncbi:methylmalonyl-CoA epimerase [Scopulibacillus darangshiensis]|uniref:Methylmalonyl-CoA epimerase n=1 Tax=Scopulibacillus darangshiensis TaxID=442528 RepID=A0A4R2PA39_9BACL|nr:methylmalonyl-CoA epimerase [Scopulibacillus darangshiensis]TCP31807.1 methylmalonyl-CoA epimerase [Scopulibacillus darangshiensis]